LKARDLQARVTQGQEDAIE
jgi:hypothetical protein